MGQIENILGIVGHLVSIVQQLNSEVVAAKQAWIICKWMDVAVFQ